METLKKVFRNLPSSICFYDTFLDSSKPNDDDRIKIAECSLLRAGYPSSTKNEDVCIHYKDFLPLIEQEGIAELFFLPVFIVHQVKIGINLMISVKILVYFLTI